MDLNVFNMMWAPQQDRITLSNIKQMNCHLSCCFIRGEREVNRSHGLADTAHNRHYETSAEVY